jgi:hypothetical protein
MQLQSCTCIFGFPDEYPNSPSEYHALDGDLLVLLCELIEDSQVVQVARPLPKQFFVFQAKLKGGFHLRTYLALV